MSTRRARIKAVASLPPRRKNIDGADKKKVVENEIEILVKSPPIRDGGDIITTKLIDTANIILPKANETPPTSPLKSPHPENSMFSKQKDRAPSPAMPKDVTKSGVVSSKRSEKVSVNTSISTDKPNVFVSPKTFGSPLRRPAVSPQIQNSKVEKEVESKIREVDKIVGNANDNSKDIPTLKNLRSDTIKSDVIPIEQSRRYEPDDYSVPNAPESVKDAVMDGIVPLQAMSSAPKPLALLKNEIISENAEVLFDPIVPLPSAIKVRPKLRPVPRLAPLRRNSIQGSASESEDENRRALLSSGSNTPALSRKRLDSQTSHSTMHLLPNREVVRIRNDSTCSSVSQITTQPPASPDMDKHLSKSRRTDMTRRMTAMGRRREIVKRDTLTMYDLIFYNPSSNPIMSPTRSSPSGARLVVA